MKIKKISALILCASLIMGSIRYPAFADEAPDTVSYVEENGNEELDIVSCEEKEEESSDEKENDSNEAENENEEPDTVSYEEQEIESNDQEANEEPEVICEELYVQEYHMDSEQAEEYYDNDALLLGFISDDEITAVYSIGTRGLDGVDRTVYEALVEEIEKVANGQANSTVFKIVLEDIPLEQYSVKAEDVKAYFDDNYQISLNNIIDYLLVNMPFEMYWHNKKEGVRSSVGYICSSEVAPEGIEGVEAGASYVTKLTNISYTISFCVDKAYYPEGITVPKDKFVTDIDTAKTSAAADTASNISDILEKNKNKDDYERLKAYKDKICELTDYNYDAIESGYDGDMNPWQLIYVFDGNSKTKVVCEGYSKAFQYLCDKDGGLDSYIVTGYLGGNGKGLGPHMWNTVKLDGQSYLVDVTNCDIDGATEEPYSNDKLFLLGKGTSYNCSRYVNKNEYETNGFKYSGAGLWYTYGNEVRSMYDSIGILDLADSKYTAIDLGELAVKVEYATEDSYTYTGSAIEAVASVSITSPETALVEDRDYTISYSNNTDADKAYFTIIGKGDYKGECGGTFTINPKEIILKADNLTVAAGTKPEEIKFTYTVIPELCKEDTLKIEPTAYKVSKDGKEISSSEPLEAGSYSIMPEGAYAGDNYTITEYKSGRLTVDDYAKPGEKERTNIDGVISEACAAKKVTYTGKPLEPGVKITSVSGVKLVSGVDYKITYASNTDATNDYKKAFAIISGIGQYCGSREVEFEIAQKKISSAVITAGTITSEVTPDAGDIAQRIRVYDGAEILEWRDDYKIDNIKPGKNNYTFEITGIGNYTGVRKGTITAVASNNIGDCDITLSENTPAYTGIAIKPTVTVKDGSETVDPKNFTVSYKNNKNVGTATVTIKGKKDYKGSKVVTFKISPSGACKVTKDDITIKNDDKITYTGKLLKPAVTVKVGNKSLRKGTDYLLYYAGGLNAGTNSGHVIVRPIGNYWSEDGKDIQVDFDIQRAEFKKTVIKKDSSKRLGIYFNGKKLVAGVDFNVVDNESVTSKSGKTTYTVTIKVADNSTNFKDTKGDTIKTIKGTKDQIDWDQLVPPEN